MTAAESIQAMADRIVRDFHPIRLILFGSHACGDAGPESDIDLLVVLPQVTDKRRAAVEIRRALADFAVCKDIIVATPEETARRGDLVGTVLRPALREGKVLFEIPLKCEGKQLVRLGARASRPHRGWYSRGYLPHFDQPDLVQMITFRLHDALPTAKRAEWEELLKIKNEVKRRKEIEAYLDAGYGSCSLRDQRIAQLVEETLLHFDGQRYHLLAWVIMPNHVHVLIETFPRHPLVEVLHSWKSFTAKEANAILKRNGIFWQPEYFDRAIRDERHWANAVQYIHDNPVKAGLVGQAEKWPYSSASRKNAGETPALPAR